MKFKIPESIDGLDLDALRGLLKEARAAGRDIVGKDDADISEDELQLASDLMAFMEQVESAISEKEDAQAKVEKTLSSARNAFSDPEEGEGDESEEDGGEAPTEEPAAGAESEKEPVAVAASAKTKASAVKAAARNGKAPEVPETPAAPVAVITAAADVPGIATGADLPDLDKVGEALVSRMSRLPSHRVSDRPVRNRYGVAQINLAAARTDGLYVGNPDFRDEQELVMAASREARLNGNSLVAAGTWCSPSETLYSFCSQESTDGIIDLPSISAPRGGIRYTKGPDFSAIYADSDLGWNWSEAEVEAEEEPKPCVEVACPSFTDVRLRAIGLCIKAGLLTNAAYPELVRRYVEAALIAHQHKVAAYLYTTIAGASTTRSMVGGTTAMDSLAILEFAVEAERQAQRMSFNTTFEVLLPVWARASYRADLARRGGVEAWNISDQQIDAYFATRRMRVQWLYNTGQDIAIQTNQIILPGYQSAGTPSVASVDAVIYPAGTWVKATTDVISLDAVYDSVGLSNNTYTALFAEEGVALVNPCGRSVKITLPLCASGQVGPADIDACLGYNPDPEPEPEGNGDGGGTD